MKYFYKFLLFLLINIQIQAQQKNIIIDAGQELGVIDLVLGTNNGPRSMNWEEDYSQIKEFFDSLRAGGVTNFREFFEEHPEAVTKCASMAQVLDVNKVTLEFNKAKNYKGIGACVDKRGAIFTPPGIYEGIIVI